MRSPFQIFGSFGPVLHFRRIFSRRFLGVTATTKLTSHCWLVRTREVVVVSGKVLSAAELPPGRRPLRRLVAAGG